MIVILLKFLDKLKGKNKWKNKNKKKEIDWNFCVVQCYETKWNLHKFFS